MNMAVQANRTDDEQLEDMIQRKGKVALRVTPADIEANITSEHYFTAAEGEWAAQTIGVPAAERREVPQALRLLTFCVLVLRNGFTVTGESACASPENFDAEIGRKIARDNAKNKIWLLEGYLLKQRLHESA